VNFHFRNADPSKPHLHSFTSSQNLNVSCATQQLEQALACGVRGFDSVEIVSGICLFAKGIISKSVPAEGGVYADVLTNAKPTLYETEYIARASSAVSQNRSNANRKSQC